MCYTNNASEYNIYNILSSPKLVKRPATNIIGQYRTFFIYFLDTLSLNSIKLRLYYIIRN